MFSVQALNGSEEDRAAVKKELEDSFSTMGMSIDSMISALASQSDPQSQELVGLFKRLMNPKANFIPTKLPSSKPLSTDDLLGI